MIPLTRFIGREIFEIGDAREPGVEAAGSNALLTGERSFRGVDMLFVARLKKC